MSGARLFAILVAFIAVVATAVSILATSDAETPQNPAASALGVLDQIMGVDKGNRPHRPSAAQRARRKHRPRTHRVTNNETPTTIATKYGLTVPQLRSYNPGVDVHLLQKGQRLRLR
jgi:hypothetical protein